MSGESLFNWDGIERRKENRPEDCPFPECPPLTDSEIDQIAEKAAERAVAKLTAHVYQEVGKGVVKRLFWIVGALAVGLYLWASAKGLVK